MKCRILLSLLTVALMAMGTSTARAANDVDVQLNLRYTDPADPSEGGTWDLLAKTATPGSFGIAGLVVNIGGNDLGVTGVDAPALQITPNALAFDNATSIFRYNLLAGGDVEIVAGDDLSGSLVMGVGLGSSASNVPTDDLGNSVWDNSSLLASGTFAGAGRPVITAAFANEFDSASTLFSALSAIGDTNDRGDSLNSLALETPGTGLFSGDSNRDGAVGAGDSATLFSSWDPLGTTNGWDDGDFNDDGAVGAGDSAGLFSNWDPLGSNYIAPALSAVPEPSSVLLLAAAGCCALVSTRRKS